MGNKTKKDPDQLLDNELVEMRSLILHNDDHHSFDYVIEALVDVCKHDALQAEQCTYLVHYRGKCDVKKGSYKELSPYKEGLIDKKLNATIE